jgi:hypothetical protein
MRCSGRRCGRVEATRLVTGTRCSRQGEAGAAARAGGVGIAMGRERKPCPPPYAQTSGLPPFSANQGKEYLVWLCLLVATATAAASSFLFFWGTSFRCNIAKVRRWGQVGRSVVGKTLGNAVT